MKPAPSYYEWAAAAKLQREPFLWIRSDWTADDIEAERQELLTPVDDFSWEIP